MGRAAWFLSAARAPLRVAVTRCVLEDKAVWPGVDSCVCGALQSHYNHYDKRNAVIVIYISGLVTIRNGSLVCGLQTLVWKSC